MSMKRMNAPEQNSESKEPTMYHRWYDVHEAAEMLRVSPNRLRYLALRKRIKSARVNGKRPHHRFLFKYEWLQRYLRRNGYPSKALEANTKPQGAGDGNPAQVVQ